MDMLVVRGGTPLRGTAAVSGAKNAALPIMAASLAGSGPLVLHNVPDLADVRTQAAVLAQLGVSVDWDGAGTCHLHAVDETPCIAHYELVRRMRASVCVLGPLLAKRRRACVSLPGGCNIGHRPIDLHLKGLAALGADIRIQQGYVVAQAERLRGARIDLRGPQGGTVTGTCNVMTAACLASGTTVIDSAAREPEVVDLARCLNRMGARIEGAGTSRIVISGVHELSGAEHTVIPDRIEAATLLCAGLITSGDVTVTGASAGHLGAFLEVLAAIGATLEIDGDRIRAFAGSLRSIAIEAAPFPGLPTDLQAQLTALLTQAEGRSRVADRVFPQRFMHLPELARLGALVRREGNAAIVQGPSALSGANVMASDLRASAALVLAALAASGETIIRRVYHLDRGYERLDARLRRLGACIERDVERPAAAPRLDELTTIPEDASVSAPHFLSRDDERAPRIRQAWPVGEVDRPERRR